MQLICDILENKVLEYLDAFNTLRSNIYMACNTFICTILLGISKSYKINIFKYFTLEIIEFIFTKIHLISIIFPTRSLNTIILVDSNSNRPNIMVQIIVLHGIYSVIAK